MTCRPLTDTTQRTYFNPHPRIKDDLNVEFPSVSKAYFNPHPRIEDDEKYTASLSGTSLFQSTSSHRGWPIPFKCSKYLSTKFQSTSSHRGWLQVRRSLRFLRRISIHILAQRMTFSRLNDSRVCWYFNPHPRTEDDEKLWPFGICSVGISIHILAQRMTCVPTNSATVFSLISIHILAQRMTY